MTVLSDARISQLVRSENIVSNTNDIDIGAKNSKIQPSSIDLTIGKIFTPGHIGPSKPGSIESPLKAISLNQGATAVIQTLEKLSLPNHIAAIAFPPSSLSLNGILMTNPGHVDPGYSGTLSFTVINMGRKPFELRVGQSIVTVLFLNLDGRASVGYSDLKAAPVALSGKPDDELLDRLSADFLDIDNRAKAIAISEAKNETQRIHVIGALIGAIAVVALGLVQAVWKPWEKPVQDAESRIAKMEGKLSAIGTNVSLGSIEQRLAVIEEKLMEKKAKEEK